MPPLACPNCHTIYPDEDVNVQKAIAYCDHCGTLTSLTDLTPAQPATDDLTNVEINNPPKGCRLIQDIDAVRATVSLRSFGGAAFMLFFTLFWNGITSVFVLVNIANTVALLGGTLPAWFPSPSSSPQATTAGEVIFMWVFLTPFMLVGALTACIALTCLVGRLEVSIRGDRGTIFTGFGPIGWRRRFDALHVQSVTLGETEWTKNNRTQPCLIIESNKTIRLASNMHKDKRAWLGATLRDLLIPNR